MPLDNREAEKRYVEVLQEELRRRHQRRFHELYPDETITGPDGEVATVTGDPRTRLYARSLYVRHLEFFTATAGYREIAAVAANRVGKTTMGAYAVTAWLTGLYPDWWTGRRFKSPVRAWAGPSA